jgi:protein MpaA
MIVERPDRGTVRHASSVYGSSREGASLTVWLPEDSRPEILILAAIHGDESETTVVLSEALRSIESGALRNAAILCANPDGLLRGTRGNSIGVDLNRNFPTSNWSAETVCHRSRQDDPRDIELSPGATPASEPETRALLSLLEGLKPRAVVSLHAALACIDDADLSPLARWISVRSGLPLLEDIGYPTPGSFGSWASEHGLTIVTYELEAACLYDLKDRHSRVLVDILTGGFEF